jgi:hypothetical protein
MNEEKIRSINEKPVSKYNWINAIFEVWDCIILGFEEIVRYVDDILTDIVYQVTSRYER